jgi:hypothetical protein
MRSAAARAAGAGYRRAWCRVALAALALALAAAGCTDGRPTASFVSARTTPIAFESIDGPPQAVFQKLVENLAAEAVARRVDVISREATPYYRVRGYLAAHVERQRIHVGWVWDVYDGEKRRVLRIAGEEPGSRRGGDAWTAADDAMLRRIARASMDRLAAFLDGGGGGRAPVPGTTDDMTVAAAGDAAQPTALAAALAMADSRQ